MDIWAIILAAIALILKEYLNERKNNKRFSDMDNYHKERISALESESAEFRHLLHIHINSDTFRTKFKNVVFNFTSDKINNSELLSKEVYKKALIDFSENITLFALKFFYSDRRDSKDVSQEDRKLQLKVELDSIIYDFLNVLKVEITTEKAYTASNKTYGTTFSGWIVIQDSLKRADSPGIMTLSYNLIERFIINKIKESDLQEITIDYLGKVISKFKENIQSFNELEGYEDKIMKSL